jgi:sugar phosphate isomerase/epimerase
MKIGYCTWGMPQVEVDDAIPYLADLGYDGVEITVIPGYTTELSTLTSEERRRIKKLFMDHNLEMPAIAGHTSLLDPDVKQHAVNMKRLRATVELAADLTMGELIPCLDTTPGGKPDEWTTIKERLLNETGALVDFGAQHGVTLALEPHIGCCLCDVERTLWLLEQINSPYLKLNYDISHFDVAGIPTAESVAALAPHTIHTHVKDQRGKTPDYEFLIPGEGDFDYVEYLHAMKAAGYDDYITVEVSIMVQKRDTYDPLAAATLSYQTLSGAFEEAEISRA